MFAFPDKFCCFCCGNPHRFDPPQSPPPSQKRDTMALSEHRSARESVVSAAPGRRRDAIVLSEHRSERKSGVSAAPGCSDVGCFVCISIYLYIYHKNKHIHINTYIYIYIFMSPMVEWRLDASAIPKNQIRACLAARLI